MSRKNIIIVLLLLGVLGCVCGWFLWLWLNPAAASPVGPDAVSQTTKPKSHTGYCCVATGSACEPVADPGLCFRGGGKAFNAVKRNCDYYCLNIKP